MDRDEREKHRERLNASPTQKHAEGKEEKLSLTVFSLEVWNKLLIVVGNLSCRRQRKKKKTMRR